jgi:hypothetical protein
MGAVSSMSRTGAVVEVESVEVEVGSVVDMVDGGPALWLTIPSSLRLASRFKMELVLELLLARLMRPTNALVSGEWCCCCPMNDFGTSLEQTPNSTL